MTHIFRIHAPNDVLIYRHENQLGEATYTAHKKGRVDRAVEVANPEDLPEYGRGHNMKLHGEGFPHTGE